MPWHLSLKWHYLKVTVNLQGALITRPQVLGLPSGFSVWESAFCLHSLVKHTSLKRKGGKEERGREKGEENHKGSIMIHKNRRYLINVA